MKITSTKIPEVKVLEPHIYGDDRGFFIEIWNQKQFDEYVAGEATVFVQDNHSKSRRGTLRGLHYQSRYPQGKLVRVTSGEVFDVAVDVRADSSTFGQWVGVILSQTNNKQLWIPKGFAHGFYVLSESAEFLYKCTDYYDPSSEVSIRWDDPTINIEWPEMKSNFPILSSKDESGVKLSEAPLL
ncbi:dTDP-4-dehydrorhamnose 3,5-epimerase [Vibrio sp. 99-8-1]|uniref:dTDP-4-dehydrorhamnose 3,5-epimerase n=1 Tax=Vibrio sp. 99-8-1 TaxID=2607602 RepID=UPI00149360CE|nr:dTDP-4-dehydrorhamnose 3,5-epimerase [Vibrio sp. 99-8-1]NOI68723.1 dTDP-4-dehydrorhamnose 3,5-epimerase [Vibrio sp. 99-8-1]